MGDGGVGLREITAIPDLATRIAALRKYVRVSPGDAQAWFVLAVDLSKHGEADAAAVARLRAIALDSSLRNQFPVTATGSVPPIVAIAAVAAPDAPAGGVPGYRVL